ncbi:MAG: Sensor histidine kinase RcsC [Syntrophus sp. SKADARSKE-3]|nr:Sensor histidine kinase RcsC [Syntrophus sp. SKADARSKE-3]
MKRTDNTQRCIGKFYPVTLSQSSFTIVRMAAVSVLFVCFTLILPTGNLHARDVATLPHSNPTSLSSKSLKTIIVKDYYPYTFVNDKGIPDGFSIDIAKAVAKVMDLKIEITVDSWENATKALDESTIDLLPMMAASPERHKSFDFSVPHTIAYDAIFLRSGSPRIRSLNDLAGKTIIVMNKDAAHDYLESSGLAAKMKLVLVDSLPDAQRTLASGRGDAALMPKLVGLILMKRLNLTNLDPSPVVIDAYNRPFSFAVKHGNQALLERLSQGMSIIKSTGQYRDIYNKWFGALEPPGLSWGIVIKYITAIVIVFLLIALGLILWTLSLRKQVALRTKHLADEIQEHKQTEEKLHNQKEFVTTLLDTIPSPIFYKDISGRYLGCNHAFCELFGMKRENIIGKSVYDMAPKEMAEKYATKDEELFERCERQTYEWKVMSIDGSKDVIFNKAPFLDATGNIAGLIGIMVDITDRKQAEEKLREVTKRLHLATASAKAGVWDWNLQTKEMIWDDRMLELYGLTRENFPGGIEAWEQGLHPDDYSRAVEECQAALCGEHDFDTEFRVRHPDGTVVHIKANGLVLRDDMGNPLRMIGLNTDITERKQVEEVIKRRDSKYRELVEHAQDGIFTITVQGQFLLANIKFCQMLGYTLEECLCLNILDTYPDDMRPVGTQRLADLQFGETLRFERPMKRQDGGIISVEAIAWKDSDDNLQAIVRDITERRQAVEQQRELEERLQRAEKMEALGTMAGGVAHDLNNVLGIVVGYSEMLLDEIDESSSLRDDVMKIMEGGQRSAAIVDDLLTLARRGVSGRKVLNLNKLILDFKKMPEWQKLFSYHPSVQIKTDLEADLLNISASYVHLEKALFNLVSNACEAMAQGGCVSIRTTNQYLDKPIHGYDNIREGDYVVLSVSDTGEGIPESDLKRIFEPFYTKKIMGRSGTGLGLAVVWGTVKDHQGYINVESEAGKGSIFTLYFPVARQDVTADSHSVSINEYMGKGEAILVVDDVKGQRDLAVALLRKLNYKVASVSSGEDALEYLKEHKVDLLVLDMIMDTGMDGLDTYKSVIKIHPQQKAIIVSGFSESDRVHDAQAIGVGAYVKKPYVIEKLGLAVRKELDRQ